MKKNQLTHILPVIALMTAGALTACDGYKKNPVSDLSALREQAQTDMTKGPTKPTVITEQVIVEKPVLVTREESTVDGKFIVITPDPQMTFSEGQTSSYNIRARALKAGVKVAIVPEGLPADAQLVASDKEAGLFVLTWKPALYTIPANDNVKFISLKLKAKVIAADEAADLEKFKGLVASEDVTLVVSQNQELPSDLQINGLDAVVQEGQITTFTVTAKVPGIDAQSSKKPVLHFFYDNVIISAGNEFRELDGSRYVSADLNKKDPEYLQDGVWKFTLSFDTKNISVQPQLSKDGTLLSKADGTRVRMSLFVTSPTGMRTPETLKQIKIAYSKSVTAPKFDVSGLAQQALEVSRGQKVTLNFTVSSSEATSKVFVSSTETTLPGAPQVVCKTAKTGKSQQNCVLSWNVPCDIAAEKLKGSVEMTAISSVSDRATESTDYSLQTQVAAKEQDLCSAKKATETKSAPASETKPAAKPEVKKDTKSVSSPTAKPAQKPAAKKAS